MMVETTSNDEVEKERINLKSQEKSRTLRKNETSLRNQPVGCLREPPSDMAFLNITQNVYNFSLLLLKIYI